MPYRVPKTASTSVKCHRNQGQRASWPVGRVLCTRLRGSTAIHLGLPLPTASCGLPASIGRAALNRSRRLAPLARRRPLDLAPGGVYRAAAVTCGAGGLLHHLFTLTAGTRSQPGTRRRSVFCGTFPRVTPGRRYRPPCPAEPGPSSAAPVCGTDAAARPARPPATSLAAMPPSALLQMSGVVERAQQGGAVVETVDPGQRRHIEIHPEHGLGRRQQRPAHEGLNGRDMADHDRGGVLVGFDEPVHGAQHPQRDHGEALPARRRGIGAGQPGRQLVRPALAGLGERQSLPLPKVSLGQVIVDDHRGARGLRNRLGRAPCSLQRRGDDDVDARSGGQPACGQPSLPDALLGQRDVVTAGEPALGGQLRRAVAQQQRRRRPARGLLPAWRRSAVWRPCLLPGHRPESGVLTRIRLHSSQRRTSSSGAALIAFRSFVLSVRLQPWQPRCRSAAAPTPPCCALSLSYSSSRSGGMAAVTSTLRSPALTDCSASSASAASLAAVTLVSSLSSCSRSAAACSRVTCAVSRRSITASTTSSRSDCRRCSDCTSDCRFSSSRGELTMPLSSRWRSRSIRALTWSTSASALACSRLRSLFCAVSAAMESLSSPSRASSLASAACSGRPRSRWSTRPSSASMSATSSSRSCASGDAFTRPR